MLVVNFALPVNSVMELMDFAKRNPGKLTFASNVVVFFHMMGETFNKASGLGALHVPYIGGNMPLPVIDLISGWINILFPRLRWPAGRCGCWSSWVMRASDSFRTCRPLPS